MLSVSCSTSPHLTAVGYKEHGAYFGAAFKKIAVDGETWVPLSPISATASGNSVTLTLHVPYGPVVADTANVTATNPAKPSFGFTLLDGSGNSVDIDNQVRINSSNEVVIQSPVTVTNDFRVNYGDTINGTSGGNIRDSQGDVYVFNGGGLDYPMHNWLVMFSIPVGGRSATSTTLNAPTSVQLGTVASVSGLVSSPQANPLPTGTLSFAVNGVEIGSAAINADGYAAITPEVLAAMEGNYSLEVAYSGDSSYLPSTSSTVIAISGFQTSSSLSVSGTQATQAEPITLSCSVKRSSGAPANGSVTFLANQEPVYTAPLVNGIASFTAITEGKFAPGAYTLSAHFNGSTEDQPSTSATTNMLLLAATEAILSGTPNPVAVNSSVVLTCKVTQQYGTSIPTGTVTFLVDGINMGTSAINSAGIGSLKLSTTGIRAGNYIASAVYAGDNSNGTSTSPNATIVVT